MEIYLIRHGKLNWEDNIKKCIGVTDIDLSEEGFERALEVSKFLKDKNVDKIYTSSLKRCVDSAKVISSNLNIPCCIEENLKEINMGIWENMTFEEIKKLYPLDYKKRGENFYTYKIEGGESFQECYKRSVEIFNKICTENEDSNNIVILTHSGVIKCLISYIKEISLKHIIHIKVEYGSINLITYNNGEFKINYKNKVG